MENNAVDASTGRLAQIRAKSSDFAARMKELVADCNLINAVQLSLGKPAASRGSFEQMVVKEVEEKCAKLIAGTQQETASAEEEKTKTQEALLFLEKELETAKSLYENAQIAACNAEVSKSAADDAMKEARSGLKLFQDEEVEQRTSAVVAAQAALRTYQEVPLTALKALTTEQVVPDGEATQPVLDQ